MKSMDLSQDPWISWSISRDAFKTKRFMEFEKITHHATYYKKMFRSISPTLHSFSMHTRCCSQSPSASAVPGSSPRLAARRPWPMSWLGEWSPGRRCPPHDQQRPPHRRAAHTFLPTMRRSSKPSRDTSKRKMTQGR